MPTRCSAARQKLGTTADIENDIVYTRHKQKELRNAPYFIPDCIRHTCKHDALGDYNIGEYPGACDFDPKLRRELQRQLRIGPFAHVKRNLCT